MRPVKPMEIGDVVWWNDPDEAVCSGPVRVVMITRIEDDSDCDDDVFVLAHECGRHPDAGLEAPRSELARYDDEIDQAKAYYLVTADRSTTYRVLATSEDDAIDNMTDADEVGGHTYSIKAVRDDDTGKDEDGTS